VNYYKEKINQRKDIIIDAVASCYYFYNRNHLHLCQKIDNPEKNGELAVRALAKAEQIN